MKNKVLVVGDILLDKYVSGSVKRISPEAPVPVVNVYEEKYVLGGAANVAYNIASLGGEVTLLGVCGYDYEGAKVVEKIQEGHIKNEVIQEKGINTIVKFRVLGNGQQIVRLDYNDKFIVNSEIRKKIIKKIDVLLCENMILVISDYNKGVVEKEICQYMIKKAKNLDIDIVVDPKGNDWYKYRNCTIITPNFNELMIYYKKNIENSCDSIKKEVSNFCSEMNIEYLLITRSEKGMLLLSKKGEFIEFKTVAKSVFDVSGEGDTVVAILALFWNQLKKEEVIELANKGAGIVVGKSGTAKVTIEELYNNQDNVRKIKKRRELIDEVSRIRNDKRIVFTNGCFDILHPGHLLFLQKASELGEFMVVAINSDKSVRAIKGKNRPVNCQEDRAYMLAILPFVDRIVIFDEEDPCELLKEMKPDVLVKGGDYQIEDILGKEYAGEVKTIEFIDGYSTSKIINRINK